MEELFFNGDSRPYWHPAHYDLDGIFFDIPDSSDVLNPISALYLKANKKRNKPPKGSIIYFHSGQFNLQYNLLQVAFLAVEGFDVLLTDYPGCGVTKGKSSFNGLTKTVEVVRDYLFSGTSEFGQSSNGYLLFGQGLGAHAALLLYSSMAEKIKGVVLESSYATQKGRIKASFGPVIGDVLSSLIEEIQMQPIEILPTVKAPILLVYPQKDDFARGEKKRLINSISPSQWKYTELLEVPKKKYLNVFAGNSITPPHFQLIEFLKKCITPLNK